MGNVENGTFSGDTAVLFPEPVYPSAMNVEKAHQFVDEQWGGGGTEMMKAIKAALDPSDKQDHLAIAVFLTVMSVRQWFRNPAVLKMHAHARVFASGLDSRVKSLPITGVGLAQDR